MKRLALPVILGCFVFSCGAVDSNNMTVIKYVVKDFSETPVDKEITFTSGWTGEELVVIGVKNHWEREFELKENLDATLTAAVVGEKFIHMGVYIYINNELAEFKEYQQVKSLSITYIN